MEAQSKDTEEFANILDLAPGGVIKHARRSEDLSWFCKETGSQIKTITITRSEHHMPGAGFGKTSLINHIYCPECNGEPDIQVGDGVYIGDLVPADSEVVKQFQDHIANNHDSSNSEEKPLITWGFLLHVVVVFGSIIIYFS